MPMASDRETPAYYRVQFAARIDAEGPFEGPRPLPELVFPEESTVDAFLTDDGLTLFYVSGPAFGPADLYVAARRSTADPFEHHVALDELNSASDERDPWLSPDGTELYFASDRSGHYDIYVAAARREPAVASQ
jgi:Tol biopolymer transport system component